VLLLGLEEDQAPGGLFENLRLEGLLNERGLLRRGDTGVEFEKVEDALVFSLYPRLRVYPSPFS
jgi:hypothetical protein